MAVKLNFSKTIDPEHRVKFESYDWPYLYLEYCGVHWAYNPQYGSWLNLNTNKIEDPPEPVKEYMKWYYEIRDDIEG